MESYGCSYSVVLRRSQSPNMLKQGSLVEQAHAGGKSEKVGKDVDSAAQTTAEVQVKKENTENENQGGRDVSWSSSFCEVQTSFKSNCPRLPEETNLAEIKEERRDTQSSSVDTQCTGEARGIEKDFQKTKESAERRKTDEARDGEKFYVYSKSNRPNDREDNRASKEAHMTKKRKLYELYAEELSIRDDLRHLYPTSHARNFETPMWHQAREGERERAEKIAYTQYINKTYADGDPSFKRMGIHERPLDYHLDGLACKPGSRTNEQIHRSTGYLPSTDPRNRKFFATEEPRTIYFPDEQTYRSLQEELFPRAWHPKYGVIFGSPASSEYYSKNESKSPKQSKEDGGPRSKERFERHYRLQVDSHWPYLDRSAGRDDLYDKPRIAFLRVEHPVGDERKHQTKAYQAFPTEQRPESTPSEECVKYAPVPNMLIPAPKPEYLLNGRHNMPYDMGYPFPVAGEGSIAFIEKDKVFYPCCNEEIPAIHYDDMVSKARWFDNRDEGQRLDAFQVLKPGVPFSGGNEPQTMFLDDAGARIIHMSDLGRKEKNSRGKREKFKDVPLPVSASGMQHELSKKQFLSEETIPAERNARSNGGDRRKDKMFSPYSTHDYKEDKVTERKANDETPAAWQEKVNGSRTSKETLENKTWEPTKEVRIEMLKNEESGESGESGNKLVDVNQVGKEGEKALQYPKNSETQPKISLEQTVQNQDDPSSKKTISCSVCKKTFNRTSNLYTHMRTHSANKPHACEFCGKRFHQKADLRIHRYIHTGEKPHKCTKCGRGFKQLTHLKYHMRTHSDVRMYKCPYCEKGFNQKSNLQAHIFGHTGQRPHKCETCGKGFTLASTLNTHKRTHLPNKPFKCEFCDRAFYQKNALKMHYVSTHPYSSGACLV